MTERKLTILCGDPTCESYGCSQEAIDAWNAARQADAKAIVEHLVADPEWRRQMEESEDLLRRAAAGDPEAIKILGTADHRGGATATAAGRR